MLSVQHFRLREIQAENGIFLIVVPVDQLVNNIIVGLKWQDIPYNFKIEKLLPGKVIKLRDISEIPECVSTIIHNSLLSKPFTQHLRQRIINIRKIGQFSKENVLQNHASGGQFTGV
jgi:hypothetical protein